MSRGRGEPCRGLLESLFGECCSPTCWLLMRGLWLEALLSFRGVGLGETSELFDGTSVSSGTLVESLYSAKSRKLNLCVCVCGGGGEGVYGEENMYVGVCVGVGELCR